MSDLHTIALRESTLALLFDSCLRHTEECDNASFALVMIFNFNLNNKPFRAFSIRWLHVAFEWHYSILHEVGPLVGKMRDVTGCINEK
jgi:hypothetical protein